MNTNLSVALSAIDQTQTQAVTLFGNDTWTSPAGGWLTGSGRWLQVATQGVKLTDNAQRTIGMLHGLIFTLAKQGDTGRFHLETTAEAGAWKIVAATP